MADRITRQHCERMTAELNKKLNRPTTMFNEGSNVPNNGHLFIERYSDTKFYKLVEITDKGEKCPLGSNSHTTLELYNMLRAVREVLIFGELKMFPRAKKG